MNIAVLERAPEDRADLAQAILDCTPKLNLQLYDSRRIFRSNPMQADLFLLSVGNMYDVEAGHKLVQRYPKTPLVVISKSPDYSIEAFAMGARHYLVQPFTRRSLGEALERCGFELPT